MLNATDVCRAILCGLFIFYAEPSSFSLRLIIETCPRAATAMFTEKNIKLNIQTFLIKTYAPSQLRSICLIIISKASNSQSCTIPFNIEVISFEVIVILP